MKKMAAVTMMLLMMLSFSMTAFAKDPVYSPSGKPVTEEGKDIVTSPKTGENDTVLYVLGAAVAILASGAVVIKKRELDV